MEVISHNHIGVQSPTEARARFGDDALECLRRSHRRKHFIHGEPIQRLVYREQLTVVVRGIRHAIQCSGFDALLTAAMTLRAPAPCMIDENSAHRLGRRTEKVGAILPRGLFFAAEPQPGFVDERGRLECHGIVLAAHLCSGEFTQFLTATFPLAPASDVNPRLDHRPISACIQSSATRAGIGTCAEGLTGGRLLVSTAGRIVTASTAKIINANRRGV
jgi:hypothetical protein